jgi:hypothetical protein
MMTSAASPGIYQPFSAAVIKSEAIFRWITDNIAYDYKFYNTYEYKGKEPKSFRRKTSMATTQGTMIHYKPKGGVYVYGRIKDDHVVMVMLNSSLNDETVKLDRFGDIIGSHTAAAM